MKTMGIMEITTDERRMGVVRDIGDLFSHPPHQSRPGICTSISCSITYNLSLLRSVVAVLSYQSSGQGYIDGNKARVIPQNTYYLPW